MVEYPVSIGSLDELRSVVIFEDKMDAHAKNQVFDSIRLDHGLVGTLGKVRPPRFTSHRFQALDCDSVMLLHHFDEKPFSKILEIGANEESCADILQENGFNVCGIDLLEDHKKHNYVRIVGDFVPSAYFLSDDFDSIFCISALEHFGLNAYGENSYARYDQEAVIKMYHCLRMYGTCYLTVPYGKNHVESDGWRIYNKESLQKLISVFEDHSLCENFIKVKEFFLSGHCNCPSENGIVKEGDADNYADTLPHVTVFLKLEKC